MAVFDAITMLFGLVNAGFALWSHEGKEAVLWVVISVAHMRLIIAERAA